MTTPIERSAKDIHEILELVEFQNYRFCVVATNGNIYLQAVYLEADIVTGAEEDQHTRKWLLSAHMTKSEIVQTAFKCVMTSMEHRTREEFKYRGKRIFGPHFDVDGLWNMCRDQQFDVRVVPA